MGTTLYERNSSRRKIFFIKKTKFVVYIRKQQVIKLFPCVKMAEKHRSLPIQLNDICMTLGTTRWSAYYFQCSIRKLCFLLFLYRVWIIRTVTLQLKVIKIYFHYVLWNATTEKHWQLKKMKKNMVFLNSRKHMYANSLIMY